MSRTCQVIQDGFFYFPYISEGGDPHLEDKVWNKEVITITLPLQLQLGKVGQKETINPD
jgi:hypothetical protein